MNSQRIIQAALNMLVPATKQELPVIQQDKNLCLDR